MAENMKERRRKAVADRAARDEAQAQIGRAEKAKADQQQQRVADFVARFNATTRVIIAQAAAAVNADSGRYQLAELNATSYQGPTCAPVNYVLRGAAEAGRRPPMIKFQLEESGMVQATSSTHPVQVRAEDIARLNAAWAEEVLTLFLEAALR